MNDAFRDHEDVCKSHEQKEYRIAHEYVYYLKALVHYRGYRTDTLEISDELRVFRAAHIRYDHRYYRDQLEESEYKQRISHFLK